AVRPVVRARLRQAQRPLAVPVAPHRRRAALLTSRSRRSSDRPSGSPVKTIGIVGGIGPESTVDYYKLLLKRAPELGASRSPQIVINSVDYWEMRRLLDAKDDAG